MGRRFLGDNVSLIHPLLHLSFLVAGLAASMAIITAICSVRFRRRSKEPSPPESDPLEIAKESSNRSTTPINETVPEHHEKTEDNDMLAKELPLPPAMQQPKDALPSVNLKKITSERKASFSLNLKMPRSLSVAINGVGEQIQQKEDKIKGMLKTEDSVWMKTIILGEKCVPDDEEDPVIYEGKGKKIAAYHPRSYSTVSRQCSFLDPDALSSLPQTQEERIDVSKKEKEERINNS